MNIMYYCLKFLRFPNIHYLVIYFTLKCFLANRVVCKEQIGYIVLYKLKLWHSIQFLYFPQQLWWLWYLITQHNIMYLFITRFLCGYANLHFKKSHLRACKYFLNISFYNMKYMFAKLSINHYKSN